MNEAAKRRLIAELAEGGRRAAKTTTCPRCGAPTLTGDDHDEVAHIATVDAHTLNPAEEFIAILDGQPTYDLVRQRTKDAKPGAHALYHREPWHIHSTKPPPGTVHQAHRCNPDRKVTLW